MIEQLLIDTEVSLEKVARKVAKERKVVLRLSLWRHEHDKGHREVTNMGYQIDWMIPLHGVSVLEKEIVHDPEMKKYLQVGSDITMDGSIMIRRLINEEFDFGSTAVSPLQTGVGLPDKKSPEALVIQDVNCKNSWVLKLEFTSGSSRYLKKVSLVHDSRDHPEITEYIEEKETRYRVQQMRQTYRVPLE